MKDCNQMTHEIDRVENVIEDLRVYREKLIDIRDRFTDMNVPCEALPQRNKDRSATKELEAYEFYVGLNETGLVARG